MSRKVWAAIFGAGLCILAGHYLLGYRAGSGLVNLGYDLLLVARGDRAADGAVMVFLDEASHLKLQQPLNAAWDRGIHARMIERLRAAGARAIVFDIVFSDANPRDPEKDRQLAEAIRKAGNVVLGADHVPTGRNESQIVPPFDLLLDATAGIGSVEVVPGGDMVVREHTPETQIPSLSWAAAEVAQARATTNQVTRDAHRWLNYYGPPGAIPSRSYADALDPTVVPDSVFKDQVVFIGARIMTRFAGERKDEYRNPFSSWLTGGAEARANTMFVPGVEIQATGFLNLLRDDWLRRPARWVEQLGVILIGLAAGAGLIFLRPTWAGAATGLALLLLVLGAWYLFARHLTWIPWLVAVMQIGLGLSWSVLFNSVQLYVQKRLAEQTLSLYLSPKLVKKFASSPALLKPGAEKQQLTLIFTDIASFTTVSEGMDPDVLATMMNRYFEAAVSTCIHKTDGTVVKYIGDAIFAFWNAPEPQPDHCLRGCEAALRFREVKVETPGGQLLRTRIGLHTGEANVGNFGSVERVDYTALGESVNLASRLEGLNKYLGTSILASGTTHAGIDGRLVSRAVGVFRLKGFEKPVEVFELVGFPEEADASAPWRETFARALEMFRARRWDDAEAAFLRTMELKPEDGPSLYYFGYLNELRAEPPAEGWHGEVVMKDK
jgi:adenylate cyclase